MKIATIVFLFNENNQILLCMKKRGFGEGKRNGAGGKQQEGETIEQTAIRELFEETNIQMEPQNLLKRGEIYFYWDGKEDQNFHIHVFTGSYNGSFEETEEMRPQWFDISNIPYESMWEDDIFWLPKIIETNDSIEANIFFDKDGKLFKCEFK